MIKGETVAYRLRLEANQKKLGISPTKQRAVDDGDGDFEEQEQTQTQPQKDKLRPITREKVLELEYKALVSEGMTLYRLKDYYRAINAFTKAQDLNKDDISILIERANCYVKIGSPIEALHDIEQVLTARPNDPRAICSKAEAYFSMGEFEFALVFFQRGLAIRQDMSEFNAGVVKCRSAIMDSINNVEIFQPNPSFAQSRQRKALFPVSNRSAQETMDEATYEETQRLLPEKVVPLGVMNAEKGKYLGELSLDYDYLIELREEVQTYDKDEREKMLKYVEDAISYLERRAAFWCQQASKEPEPENTPQNGATERSAGSSKGRNKTTRIKVKSVKKREDDAPSARRKRPDTTTPRYEMSRIQIYEQKYGNKRTRPS